MAMSGIVTVTSAGTAVRMDSTPGNRMGTFLVRALNDNTGLVYLGNVSDDVASTNGFHLADTDAPILIVTRNLNQYWLDAAADGEGVAWLQIE